jgi:hypothetical protein
MSSTDWELQKHYLDWMVDNGHAIVTHYRVIYIRETKFVFEIPYEYNYAEIKEKNKVINNEILEEFTKRTYKPEKIINLNSPDLEKEMDEYISIYE